MTAAGVLWSDGLRSWTKARGLWLIALAALLPPILTGSWALTHQDDIVPSALSISPDDIRSGDVVNVTAEVRNDWDHAAGPFNATLEIGYFEPTSDGDLLFRGRQSETVRVPRLEPGATFPLNLTWTAQGGTFIAQVRADTDDEVAELEENNNHLFRQFTVRFPDAEQTPPDPAGLNATSSGGSAVDLAVTDISWTPSSFYMGSEANVTIEVANRGASAATNATVLLRVFGASGLGYSSFPSLTRQQAVDLAPGASTTVTFPWKPSSINQYAIQGVVLPPANHTEAAPQDNVLYREHFVDREFKYEPPEERATAKAFYHDVLEVLHIRLLLPLLALFYAGSILDDERRRGGLDALLTRPVPRWQLPVVRSLQGFLVTAVAVSLGVLVTYLLLLGLPQAATAAGYLWMPLLLTLLCLFAYGGLFTLVGVWAEKPYLVGLVYVLGVETAIVAGRAVLINGRPLLQDWVTYFSLAEWMRKALEGWDAKTAAWLGGDANTALWVVLGIGVGGLVAAAWWMTKREFSEA